MEHPSGHQDAVVAVFTRHQDAEEAVRKLASGGFDMTHYSIVGQGFHSEEKVVGFYNMGDRIKFWGENGAFWGGLWSLFFGGIFLTIPMVGPVMVLGHLAAMVVAAVAGCHRVWWTERTWGRTFQHRYSEGQRDRVRASRQDGRISYRGPWLGG
jgi:hypothetical protein